MPTPRDPAAPLWLVQLLRGSSVPVPWGRALRAVLALAVPLAVAFPAERPEYGVLVSVGALPAVLADRGGSYRQRAFRLGSSSLAATFGFAVGLLTKDAPLVSAGVVVLVAMLSVLVSSVGDTVSIAGLMMLVFTVLGAGQYLVGVGIPAILGSFLVGIAWSLVVGLAGWAVRGTSPERAAVAQVFVELSVLLSVRDADTARAARHQLTIAMNSAYDQLLSARARLPRRDAAYRRLLTLLSEATPLVEAAVAMVNSGRRAPRPVIDHLMHVAAAVLGGTRLPERPPVEEGPSSSVADGALYAGLARLGHGDERAPRPPASPRVWLREQLAGLTADRATWLGVARLALCMAIAEALSLVMPLGHAHWIPLTVALVLKPELGSVFGRAVLRGIGTVGGVGLGALVLLAYPHGWVLAALAAMFAAGVAIGKAFNYGILSACITPLIIIQMDVQNLGEPSLLVERLTHTLLGCAVVLVFGYWLWPGARHRHPGPAAADAIDAVCRYVDIGLRNVGPDADRVERRRARRRAYRALANLRAALAHVLVEPSPAGRRAIELWSVTVGLERVSDAVTEVCVSADHGGARPTEVEIGRLTAAIAELAAAVRQGREPERTPLPEARDGTALAALNQQVDAVLDTLRGAHT
ncbi:FUSC family protein [Haloechinothrix alba]|uniref:FUSC family protein n=1 Tax=Haloechinothrix alba TaxID=664784 RepID=UPI001595C91F|nr:FUSC family protein [Haloechinothrix alba]